MNFPDNYFEMMCARMQSAFRAMTDLERGDIANPADDLLAPDAWDAVARSNNVKSKPGAQLASMWYFTVSIK